MLTHGFMAHTSRRPGSLLRRSCCLQGPIPKPDTYERHPSLCAGHAGAAGLFCAAVTHTSQTRNPSPHEQPVGPIAALLAEDVGRIGWAPVEGDKFLESIFVPCSLRSQWDAASRAHGCFLASARVSLPSGPTVQGRQFERLGLSRIRAKKGPLGLCARLHGI